MRVNLAEEPVTINNNTQAATLIVKITIKWHGFVEHTRIIIKVMYGEQRKIYIAYHVFIR